MTWTQPRHHARVLAAIGAAMTMIIGVIGIGATPAQAASSTTLCKGFKDCAREGRGTAGYASVYRRSFWSMRTGHNCTNYVAYRLTKGRLTSRPPGATDAATWGRAARAAGIPVNRTPRVGDVAWWGSRRDGAGRLGHVAYVEAVRSDGSIVISQDDLGGTFSWRKLSTSSRSWPSGFIHFPRSNGSPAGRVLSVKPGGAGTIWFSASASESDVQAGQRSYLVTIGGPRGAAGVESLTFTSAYFRFDRLKTLTTRGRTTMHLYALNTPGTGGSDTLLGHQVVTIS
jgi:surface antigen